MIKKLFLILPLVISISIISQDSSDSIDTASDVEEVVVVGSQIKGAKITGALPVSIISSEDIDALGVDSGDELLDNIAELGQNTFNQNEFSGGYNASRGDVGAFNLRDIGTGNTLTLLNGRRLITSPGYQTEPILGGSMPVMTTNSNAIPVNGAERIEILRDGASAIYGADALAGVVNTVLKTDFTGLNVRFKASAYDAYGAQDNKISIQWGEDFGNTNISIYYDTYIRDSINGSEDPKWAAMDARSVPGLLDGLPSAWQTDSGWQNKNSASAWGVFHGGSGNYIHVVPGTDNCDYEGASNGQDSCVRINSSSSTLNRVSYNELGRDMRSDLERHNLFLFINTELDNGIEAYSEIGIYNSAADQVVFPGTTLGAGSCAKKGSCTQPFLVPLSNYWLQQLVDDKGEKLVNNEDLVSNGLGLWKARHRFDTPRGYNSHRTTLRLLQGFRGSFKKWDWDSAILISRAKSKQNNTGRHTMDGMNAALALSTSDAYNPFCGPGCNDESSFLTTIFRKNTTDLDLFDFKISTNDLIDLPAGPVGMLFGLEVRKESYTDERDPRMNGTVKYTVPAGPNTGLTYPLISNIVNSSATPDSKGSRRTTSMFAELAIPVHETIDAQLALRYEDSNDYGEATVGKLAIGWQPIDQLKVRYSSSETFRAPALILVNEGFLGRSSSQSDGLLEYLDPDYLSYSMQRVTEGNPTLKPELGENESLGLVLEPIENLIITTDKWSIETEDTVGIFGMYNATLLDALIRIEGGASECTGNPNVIRSDSPTDDVIWPTNLCPAGLVQQVNDFYLNGDTRTIEGVDTSVLYSIDTEYGDFGIKLMHVHYDTKNQAAGGAARLISDAAQPGGVLADLTSPRGIDNLLGKNGSIEDKYTMKASWRKGPYQVLLSGTQWGEFLETGHTAKIDGVTEQWLVESMTVFNLTLGYKFDSDLRVRLQVKNLEDKRAPLADEAYGTFWADLHSDFGRNYNIEFYKKF
jgi:outer membrane receptor protein involved in Fe transport